MESSYGLHVFVFLYLQKDSNIFGLFKKMRTFATHCRYGSVGRATHS